MTPITSSTVSRRQRADPAVYRYDPEELKRRLAELPARARVAFALACAERLSVYSRHSSGSAEYELARAARELGRRYVAGAAIADDELRALTSRLESSPDIDDDDLAACAFVLECMRGGEVQPAVRAAERALDARERAAEKRMVISVYTPEIDAALLADPDTQAELAQQHADLDALRRDPRSASRVACVRPGGTTE